MSTTHKYPAQRPALPSQIKQLGREVRRRRLTLGMTAVALAARANITPNYLGDIETGRRQRNPSLLTVLALAKALRVDVVELLGGGSIKLSPTSIEAARLLENAPETVQNAMLQILRAFAQGRRSSKRRR